jgi:hypothetical protein
MKTIIITALAISTCWYIAKDRSEKKLFKALIYLQQENTSLKIDKAIKSDKMQRIEDSFPDKMYKQCINFKKYYFKK